MPARVRCRASQASCFALSCCSSAATSSDTLRPGQPRTTRWLGPDLVAPDHARGPIPGVEHQVQSGRDDAQHGLDPAHALQLLPAAISHGGAIVDSPTVLVREVMTESLVTASP